MADPTGKRKSITSEDADDILQPGSRRARQQSYPSFQETIPPPPSTAVDPRDAWLENLGRMAYRQASEAQDLARAALEAANRIELVIGVEPQPAQNIPGSGLLKVLSSHVKEKEDEERRKRDVRTLLAGLFAGVTLLATTLGVLKALGVLH